MDYPVVVRLWFLAYWRSYQTVVVLAGECAGAWLPHPVRAVSHHLIGSCEVDDIDDVSARAVDCEVVGAMYLPPRL